MRSKIYKSTVSRVVSAKTPPEIIRIFAYGDFLIRNCSIKNLFIVLTRSVRNGFKFYYS